MSTEQHVSAYSEAINTSCVRLPYLHLMLHTQRGCLNSSFKQIYRYNSIWSVM